MRLELIRAHHLTIDGIDRLVEAGTVIDAAELKGFSATPAMRPLDRPAWEELRRVCDRARREAGHGGRDCPGFGNLLGHPGGELQRPASFEGEG
jgi:hypothetical protein